MPDTPGIITDLCDGDNYTKCKTVQFGRDWFTIADLEVILELGLRV